MQITLCRCSLNPYRGKVLVFKNHIDIWMASVLKKVVRNFFKTNKSEILIKISGANVAICN